MGDSSTTSRPSKPVPPNSPNTIVSAVLGVLAALFTLSGVHVLGFLLGLAALITAIVGLARNEAQKFCAFLGILGFVIGVL